MLPNRFPIGAMRQNGGGVETSHPFQIRLRQRGGSLFRRHGHRLPRIRARNHRHVESLLGQAERGAGREGNVLRRGRHDQGQMHL